MIVQNVPTPHEQVLVVDDVRKSFGRLCALDGVSLAVAAGEFVALLGPNGAGKSTLMQLLTGLFTPDAGTIYVIDNDMGRNAVPALAGIGVVFQQPTLDLELSVEANLRFHAGLHGLARSKAGERIEAELSRFGLAGRRREPARALSGGNRRRVELARALLHGPRVLLMDEATVGLDPASRRDLLEHVLQLRADRSVGVLWTTHLVDEAERADRVVVLHRGRVLFDGTPADLLARSGSGRLGDAFLAMTAEAADGPADNFRSR